MSSFEPNYCFERQQSPTSSFLVELMVNGAVVPGCSFLRSHDRGIRDAITVSSSVKRMLNHGDIIRVRITPLTAGRTYRALGNGCRISVERMREFD